LSIDGQASSQTGETGEIVAATYYNTFSRAHPVLRRVRAGDTVRTKTIDASGRDETGVQRGQPSNPLTGPFYVEGAEPGDALIVTGSPSREPSTYKLHLKTVERPADGWRWTGQTDRR
jgi:hypothetical protein